MTRTILILTEAATIAGLEPSRVDAQCTDGSAPPCCGASAAAATRAVPVDPSRVAVIPFRVTTADSLLGEGFAELLAQEFTGQGGPRAVDMRRRSLAALSRRPAPRADHGTP